MKTTVANKKINKHTRGIVFYQRLYSVFWLFFPIVSCANSRFKFTLTFMRLIYCKQKKGTAKIRGLVQKEGRNFALRFLRQSEHCCLRRFLKLHKFLHRFIWRKRHSNNCKLLCFFFWGTAAVVGKHLTKGQGRGEGGPLRWKLTHTCFSRIFSFFALLLFLFCLLLCSLLFLLPLNPLLLFFLLLIFCLFVVVLDIWETKKANLKQHVQYVDGGEVRHTTQNYDSMSSIQNLQSQRGKNTKLHQDSVGSIPDLRSQKEQKWFDLYGKTQWEPPHAPAPPCPPCRSCPWPRERRTRGRTGSGPRRPGGRRGPVIMKQRCTMREGSTGAICPQGKLIDKREHSLLL